MNRRYQMIVFVEYVDVVKDSAAAHPGVALRNASEALEDTVRSAVAESVGRSVTRKGVRVHVTSAEVVET